MGLLRALYKLPLKKAQVYRGVKLDLAEVYNALAEKKMFSWWSFSSTTLDRAVLETPLFLGKEGQRTLFRIEALGVDIAAFSAMPNESEVLMLPGMPLRVSVGINKEEDPDLWTFDVVSLLDMDPVIDYVHPQMGEFVTDLSVDLTGTAVDLDDRRGNERRDEVEQKIEIQMTRTKENTASLWPSIPGFGPDKL